MHVKEIKCVINFYKTFAFICKHRLYVLGPILWQRYRFQLYDYEHCFEIETHFVHSD